jgi:sRNA-binding carbon storage regulator CsrA
MPDTKPMKAEAEPLNGNLILRRRPGEVIVIDPDGLAPIFVEFVAMRSGQAVLAIQAPRSREILRLEVLERRRAG